MNYKISKEILEPLINYLAKKPYIETFQIINALQNLEPIKEEEKDGCKDSSST